MFGITSHGGHSYEERYFVHGKGDRIDISFEEGGKSIDRGNLAWVHCVINKNENFYIFYGPFPTQFAVSFDMYE